MPHNQQLNEGLRPMDLAEMVNKTFEVDTFRSKMGEDRDVCVLTFTVLDRNPAKDLMEFIEKGYNFVLDADVSSGENTNGEYSVFVELSRTKDLAEHIRELTYGIKKLTGISDWEFRYHKDGKKFQVSEETLRSTIPPTPDAYDGLMSKMRTEGIKRFFGKTLMDDLTLDGDVITIHKPFDKQVQLRMVKEGEADTILEDNADTITMDDESMSEIFWLTKVLGDYNINKVGENFVFDNGRQAMILQRI
jgi:DNA-dependent RNA polymerase auxiliary subunit epsilon